MEGRPFEFMLLFDKICYKIDMHNKAVRFNFKVYTYIIIYNPQFLFILSTD